MKIELSTINTRIFCKDITTAPTLRTSAVGATAEAGTEVVGARGEEWGEGERAGEAAMEATGCKHARCAAMRQVLLLPEERKYWVLWAYLNACRCPCSCSIAL